MRDFLNKQIVNIVKNNINSEDNLVEVIMNTLSLGKEATYRRIRGEAPFTFSEIAKLASTFRFSLDSIIGLSFSDVAVVNTKFFNGHNLYEDYKQTLEFYCTLLKDMNSASMAKIGLAFNMIPFTFYARYKTLSAFKLFRWMHQMDMFLPSMPLSDMTLPDDVWKIHQELISEFDKIQEVTFVLDKNVFATLVNDINHFIQLGYISTEIYRQLKEELNAMLDLFECVLKEGGVNPQSNVYIYISNINFDSSYSYYETEDITISSMRVFAVNTFSTQDKDYFEMQKKWIDSLKRYSVLISGCGEMDRVKFLTKQREYINLL